MSQQIISAFNLHQQIESSDEAGEEDVVELARPPSPRQGLLSLIPGFLGFSLRMREENPYGKGSAVYHGLMTRCSQRRACEGCRLGPCEDGGNPCLACLNEDQYHCVHLTPCIHWPPNYVDRYRQKQSSYLHNGARTEPTSRTSRAMATVPSLALGTGNSLVTQVHPLGAQALSPLNRVASPPPFSMEGFDGTYDQTRLETKSITHRSSVPIPPHHTLPHPRIPTGARSTPLENPVRGYCEPKVLSTVSPHRSIQDLAPGQDPALPGERSNVSSPQTSYQSHPDRRPLHTVNGGNPARINDRSVSFDNRNVPGSGSTTLPSLTPPPGRSEVAHMLSSQDEPLAASDPILHTSHVIPRDRPDHQRHHTTATHSSSSYHHRGEVDSPIRDQARSQDQGVGDQFQTGPHPLDVLLGSAPLNHRSLSPGHLRDHSCTGRPPSSRRRDQQSSSHRSESFIHRPPPGRRNDHHRRSPSSSPSPPPSHRYPPSAFRDSPPPAYPNSIPPSYHGSGPGGGGAPGDAGGGGGGPGGDPGINRGRQDDWSVPISMIIDRLQDLQIRPRQSSESTSAKMRPIQLPSPKYHSNGTITALEFYRWLSIFIKLVTSLKLNSDQVLAELGSSKTILPEQLRTIATQSTDLRQAIETIKSRFPPLSSVFPELHRQIVSGSLCDSNHQRLEQAGALIEYLTLMKNWFPRRDLQREDVLLIVNNLEGQKEGTLQLLDDIRRMDEKKGLPETNPNYSSYVSSLILRLERLRGLWSELSAALSIGQRQQVGAKNVKQSFSTRVDSKEPPKRIFGGNRGGRGGKGGMNIRSDDRSGGQGGVQRVEKTTLTNRKKKGCIICTNKDGSVKDDTVHPPWKCELLPKIRSGHSTIKDTLCTKCCTGLRDKKPHDPGCHLKNFLDKKTGSMKTIDLSCKIHNSPIVHQKLCTRCGPQLPPPKPPSISSFAIGVKCLNTDYQSCAFMSEIVDIVSLTGDTIPCKIQYDSLGGSDFSSDIPVEFNHGDPHEMSEVFSLNTIMGSQDYQLPKCLLLLNTPKAGKLWVTTLMTPFPDSPYLTLSKEARRYCDLAPYTPEDFDNCTCRVILGVENAVLFPNPIPTPPQLSRDYPGLTLWKSKLSGGILFQGSTSRPSIQSFLSFSEEPSGIFDPTQ